MRASSSRCHVTVTNSPSTAVSDPVENVGGSKHSMRNVCLSCETSRSVFFGGTSPAESEEGGTAPPVVEAEEEDGDDDDEATPPSPAVATMPAGEGV